MKKGRVIALLLSILFLLFAALQLNDPDPFRWVGLYLLVAGLSCAQALGKKWKAGLSVAIALCLSWALFFIPDVADWVQLGMPSIAGSMKAESPHVEFVREFLGLTIAIAALVFLYRQKDH